MISDETAQAMADSALYSWGQASAPPRLVKNRENIVFEAHLKDGRHVALREGARHGADARLMRGVVC